MGRLTSTVLGLALLVSLACAGQASRPPTASPSALGSAPAVTPAPAALPVFDHIFVIVMENHSYGTVMGAAAAPYIHDLARAQALAANYTQVGSPSLPNYLALTGGSTFSITSDCTGCFIGASNLADSVEASGRTWKAYMEGMPRPCFGGDAYPYAQKHDPFYYFDSIRNAAQRCARIVPLTQLSADLSSTPSTPSFVWITPDLCNDTHDCDIGVGDRWLRKQAEAIMSAPAFSTQSSLMVVTWDEGDASSNQVATILAGPRVHHGYQSGVAYDHYSLLRTIESSWGLPPLAKDATATTMADMFQGSP